MYVIVDGTHKTVQLVEPVDRRNIAAMRTALPRFNLKHIHAAHVKIVSLSFGWKLPS